MNAEEEKEFVKFLVQQKRILSLENYKACRSAQHGLKKLGMEKTLDKILVEKGMFSATEMSQLWKEHKGGDEDLIPGYRILHKLGEGAVGEVYSGLDLLNGNRPVAIKILFPHLGKNKATAKRFLQEAKICIQMQEHAHIVKGYEVGYEANHDFFFYVMELIEGRNIREILKEKGKFSEPLAIRILLQMAEALQCAFEAGLVHRDIKPDNIMLNQFGDAKLCDLGLARRWEEEDSALTRTGAILGTPFYISPEAADGLPLDSRSDMYSLGATIYHMTVGHPPFEGANTAIVLNRHRKDPLVPPIELCPELTIGFSAIIEMMLAKKPEERYQNPTELLEDIKKLQNGYAPKALLKLKESYGIIETIRKPKDLQASVVMEAIPASETDEVSIVKPVETFKIPKMEFKGIRRQDMVEEYRIEDESPHFESCIYVKPYQKKPNMLVPFFTSSERSVLARSPGAQSKLLALGAIMGSLALIFFLFLIFVVLQWLKRPG